MLASNQMWHEADHQRLQAQNLPMVGAWANRPGSPANGQRYNSTDGGPGAAGMDFQYNAGIAAWVSADPIFLPIQARGAMPFAQATTQFDLVVAGSLSLSGFVLQRFAYAFFPTSAQSGANFYTFTIKGTNNTNVSQTVTLSGTTTTSTFTSGQWNEAELSATANNQFANTFNLLELNATPTGAPGTFYFFGTAQIKLIKQ